MKKNLMKLIVAMMLIASLLMACTAYAAPSRGDLIRFTPTTITVEANAVTVEGYFVNLNTTCSVKNFTEFEMTVYESGEELISGTFGDINQFTVPSMGATYQSFTFNGSHSLNVGVYDCNDYIYTACAFGFTYVEN